MTCESWGGLIAITWENPYLFEMANIRDQNTWVHQQDKEAATEKAKDLVRMAVARALLLDPLQPVTLGLNKSALVVGGGVAGMVASHGFTGSRYTLNFQVSHHTNDSFTFFSYLKH